MYAQYRNVLINKGYIPVPTNGKIPCVKRFTDEDYVPPEGFSGKNIAIVCGSGNYPICAIDIDSNSEKITKKITEIIYKKLKPTISRVGKPPNKTLFYRYDKKGIRKKQSYIFQNGSVEFLGKGQTCIIYGIHPETRQIYTWESTKIIQVSANELPYISEMDINELIPNINGIFLENGGTIINKDSNLQNNIEYNPTDPLDITEPVGLEFPEIIQHLSLLNPDCDRKQWINIGMAVHYETKGLGFKLWNEWSAKGVKYKEEEMKIQWNSFGKYQGKPITFAYILKLTKQEKIFDTKNEIFIPTWKNEPERPDPILLLHKNRILSRGSLSIISAPAGQGKTQLVTAICASIFPDIGDIDTLGFSGFAKSITYIDSEQSPWEHHNTWQKFMFRIGLKKWDTCPENVKFRLISGIEKLEDRLNFLFNIINNDPPDLIILDGIGDFVRDVNDSEECTTLIYKLTAMLRVHNTSLLVTLHVNPTMNAEKMRGVLGSELWRKSEFSAIIKRLDEETRCLTTEYALGKNRSSTDILSTYFRWCAKTKMMISTQKPRERSQNEKEQQDYDQVRELLLLFLTDNKGKEVCKTDITATVLYGWRTINKVIQDLVIKNWVTVIKKGKKTVFAITKAGENREEDLTLW